MIDFTATCEPSGFVKSRSQLASPERGMVLRVREMSDPAALTLPVVIIPSMQRPTVLHETLQSLAKQTIPFELILSLVSSDDVLPESLAFPFVRTLYGPRGSTVQRNHALRSITTEPECVFLLDDDMELAPDYLEQMVRCFRRHPEISVVNAHDLAADRFPNGLSRAFAQQLLVETQGNASCACAVPDVRFRSVKTSYGGRMAFRGSLLGQLQFDERLVLYGFLEDLDFALRCLPFGALVESSDARCVHLEVRGGRISLERRGYSDIVNPFYIWSKKTGFAFHRALLGSVRRTVKNCRQAWRQSDASRLRGNILGWCDVVRGRLQPEHILKM